MSNYQKNLSVDIVDKRRVNRTSLLTDPEIGIFLHSFFHEYTKDMHRIGNKIEFFFEDIHRKRHLSTVFTKLSTEM